MHPNALLELTTELIHRVLQLQHAADGVVSDFFRQNRALGTRGGATPRATPYAAGRRRLISLARARCG